MHVDLYEANFQLPFTDNRQSLKESQKYQKYLDLAGAFVNERVQTNHQKGTDAWDFLILSETKSKKSRYLILFSLKIYRVIYINFINLETLESSLLEYVLLP